MQYIIFFIVMIFFQACTTPVKTINRHEYKVVSVPKAQENISIQKDSSSLYNIEIQTVQKTKNKYSSNKIYTGSIKGIISKLYYSKNKKAWMYEIIGKDMSNAKLPYAEFYYSKKLASEGDFVYVILKDSNLKDLFFIKKANRISKKRKFAKRARKIRKTDKLGRRSIVIGVPSVENITF